MQYQQRRSAILVLSLIFWLLTATLCRADGPHLSESQLLLLRVSRKTVNSLATLDLAQIPLSVKTDTKESGAEAASAAQPWALVRIMPGPDSGGIAASTKPDVKGQGQGPDLRWRGTFQVLATLTATGLTTVHSTGSKSYLFTIPWPFINHEVSDNQPGAGELMDWYAPFASGGLALFQLSSDPATGNLTSLPDPPPYMIPDPWQKDLGPAWQFLHAHSPLFLPKNTVHNQVALRKMLTDPNPFIAIAACRALTQTNLLSLPQMQAVLTQARGERQAAFLFLIMRAAVTGPDSTQRETMVTGLVSQATDASELTGILAGLNAFSPEGIRAFGWIHQTGEQIGQRLTALGASGQAEPNTAAILQSSNAL